MKKINKSSVPSELQEYVFQFPVGHIKHTWKDFCENVEAKRAVQRQLKADQRGLCAYCEINLLDIPKESISTDGMGVKPDFRVDHFHPKNHQDNQDNHWELDWKNLFGVCTGGDEKNVIEPTRFSEKKSNRHCDSPKKNKVYDGVILNPLSDIPSFPNLWKISDASNNEAIFLEPDKKACDQQSSTCFVKAENTLQILRLNCNKVAEFRANTILALMEEIEENKIAGMRYDEAVRTAMKAAFNPKSPSWPQFFSTIRAYFGKDAEKRLCEIGYNG